MLYPFGVMSAKIDLWWPYVEPLLRKPIGVTELLENYNLEDIKAAIKARDMQLWVGMEGHEIIGVAVTQIFVFPRRKVLDISTVGMVPGKLKSWLPGSLETFCQYAAEHGCRSIRGYGRFGWQKLLAKHINLHYESAFEFEVPECINF